MTEVDSKTYFPELVFCISAAAGTDSGSVSDALAAELAGVDYVPVPLKLSKLMAEIPGLEHLSELKAEDERIRQSMIAGNEIRRVVGKADAVARLALTRIRETREKVSGDRSVPAERHAFIISSLKRPEELEMFRKLFGQRAILISVYEHKDQRIENLCRRIANSKNSSDPESHKATAERLIETDQKERSIPHGQLLEDVFPLADVFLKAGISLRVDARRFVQLLFQAPFITPTVDEILMFQARAAAQRSADLSRQVGAVIATKTGEILATGCNEVPRAGGGVNWDDVAGTEKDYRDYKVGQDAAAGTRKEIVGELLDALANADWLVEEKKALPREQRAQEALQGEKKPLAGTMVASLLEFGRIVHAEMAAICDAAMRGISVKEGTLFCTTFPCHMCARHIVASGIKRVVYIEPYPKSRAKKLYKRAIQVDQDREADEDAVKFEAFVGIAPTRFLDLFEMVPRKDINGYALPDSAPRKLPRGVIGGALSAGTESKYLEPIAEQDWTKLDVNRTEYGEHYDL